MKVLIASIGSAGDVHPFVGIALALRERGHSVRFATNAYFAPLLERHGLPLLQVGTREQFEEATAHPALWSQFRGFGVLAKIIRHSTRAVYAHVEREAAQGDTVVVGHPLAFGARVAHELLGVPLATLHLAPSTLWSVEDMPVPSRWIGSTSRWPKPARRLVVSLGDRFADLALAPALNRFRAELGLPPARHVAHHWWHSPQCVIGLFPDWFAARQPDWPAATSLTGFPLYDERDVSQVPRDLAAFLAGAESAGDPPIAFAPGSSNRQAQRFFESAADACRRLGRRGLLLTRYPEQLPSRLPAGVRHFAYAPFSAVLPRCGALVHHGGIGTAAQALAAGLPQLVMPMTFDQPDNAVRLERLGVGRMLLPEQFRGDRLARRLESLADPEVVRRAGDIRKRFRGIDPIARTCDLIEAAASGSPAPAGDEASIPSAA
ncbi:MAG: glycosyltransferase [Bryobacterales bacterium]|nr:glycosyltransferase [Bryobacterales bacterium]